MQWKVWGHMTRNQIITLASALAIGVIILIAYNALAHDTTWVFIQ